MRLKLDFELNNNQLDIQYRKAIISFIKKAIQEYDEELYLQLYKPNETTRKTYTWAPILPKPKFTSTSIELSNSSLSIIFSIYHYAYALHIYNSFLAQKSLPFPIPNNCMTLSKITMLTEKKINTDCITIKFSSPLIVRNHDRDTKKDMYYSFAAPEFKEYLKINIWEQMKVEGLDKSLLNDFDIKEIEAKKTVIPVYEKKIECSLGVFQISGKPELLNYLHKAGMRIKKSNGIWII